MATRIGLSRGCLLTDCLDFRKPQWRPPRLFFKRSLKVL
jgi:hypothetical protein